MMNMVTLKQINEKYKTYLISDEGSWSNLYFLIYSLNYFIQIF